MNRIDHEEYALQPLRHLVKNELNNPHERLPTPIVFVNPHISTVWKSHHVVHSFVPHLNIICSHIWRHYL